MAKPLTAITVAKARAGAERREIGDGGCNGLYLIVQPSGHKSWALRYRSRGRPVKFTLGSVLSPGAESATAPAIDTPLSLAAAREVATRTLREVQAGHDPAVAKRRRREEQHAAAADTLQAVCEEFLRREGPRLRTLSQRSSDLGLFYKPLGQMPIPEIKRAQFVREFDRIEDQRGPVRANRAQTAVKALLNWYGGRSDDYVSVLTRTPARISISGRARSHVPSDADLKAIVLAGEQDPGPFGRYLLFTLLCACRRGESAALHRRELSPDGRVWVIPGSRYKNGRDLLIPLSAAARAIVASMPMHPGYVFSEDGKYPLGNFAARKLRFDKLCGVTGNWRIHDLRRAARTLLSRAGVNPDIAERALGHALTGVRRVYDRHEFQSEKAAAFELLAQMVERLARPPPS
jgi:integrase